MIHMVKLSEYLVSVSDTIDIIILNGIWLLPLAILLINCILDREILISLGVFVVILGLGLFTWYGTQPLRMNEQDIISQYRAFATENRMILNTESDLMEDNIELEVFENQNKPDDKSGRIIMRDKEHGKTIELTQTEFDQIKSQLQIDNLKPVNI